MDDWIVSVDGPKLDEEGLAGIERLEPADQVRRFVAHDWAPEWVAELEVDVRSSLSRSGIALVRFDDPHLRFAVTGAVASLFGGLREEGEPGPLGGEITQVETSAVLDHNMSWHTDSTSWQLPNRWQILTLIQKDRWDRFSPTSVLRWDSVLAEVSTENRDVLVRHPLGWREQFQGVAPLRAPVLGDPPRWLYPAMSNWPDDEPTEVIEAVAELGRAISDSCGIDLAIDESTLLVLDNHAILHRGPTLNPDGGRRILRLKLGGTVGDL